MDMNGNFYADAEGRKEVEKLLEGAIKDTTQRLEDEAVKVRDIEGANPKGGLVRIDDMKVLETLAGMNRHQKRAFFAERRKGASEEDAIASAEAAIEK